MRNERVILCGDLTKVTDTEGTVVTHDRDPVRLSLWGTQPSVNLKLRHISDALAKVLPGRFLDLIELATYVYCADQAVPRGGDADVAGEQWRRTLRFAVPVREPEFWRAAEVSEALRETLGFLSEDEYDFDFQPLVNGPGQQHYFEGFDRFEPGTEPEEVVLFSGGLDSLCGAVQEAVLDRRRVTLVTHRSTAKLNGR